MPIQTRGFDVNVMPQTPAVDPSLYAFDPTKISQGAMQAMEVVGTRDKLKAFREQQKEQQATRDARIAHIKAISDLAVLQANHEHAVEQAKTTAELAGFKLKGAEDTGSLATLQDRQNLEADKLRLAKMDIASKTKNYESERQLGIDEKKAEISNKEAQSAYWLAEAAKFRAEAAAKGKPVTVEQDAYLKEMGKFAAIVGMKPDELLAIADSGVLNENKIPVATELASLAQLMQKPDFFFDPLDGAYGAKDSKKKRISAKAMEVLGARAAALAQSFPPPAAKPAADEGAGDKGAPAVIEIDKDGNIKRPGGKDTPAPQKKETQASSSGVSAGDVAKGIGMTGLAVAASNTGKGAIESMAPRAGKMLSRAWEGRNAAGKFTGKALKSLPARSLSKFAARGAVGALAAPVMAADMFNDYGGGLVNTAVDKIYGGAPEGSATADMKPLNSYGLALTANSFDESLAQAKFDEIGQRINLIMSSGSLSDDQKREELSKLVQQRELLWQAVGGG